MKTLVITRELLDYDNYYIGNENVANFQGHIEIESNLGHVRFKTQLSAAGRILSKAGTSIEAGGGIEAGLGIEAGWGIEAGLGIKAGGGIKAGLSIVCKTLSAGVRIFAGLAIWKIPSSEEMEIRCEELLRGEVAFGELIITEASK